MHHVSEAQLRNVAGRCLDKKVLYFAYILTFLDRNLCTLQHAVRSEAMHTLGKLFSVARPEM